MPRAVVVVLTRDGEVELGRVVAPRCDLALVDALARLQLSSRRRGCLIRLRNVSPPLAELLELVGLAAVLGGPGPSGVDAGGQAEGREQLGVQEVADRGDPPS